MQLADDSTDQDLQDLEAAYAQRGGRFDVLVNAEGQIIGSVGLLPVNEHTVELRKMYLRVDARGQGHGRYLLTHAMDWARSQGFRRMVLETAAALTQAIALYRQFGFRPYAAPHLARRCDQALELEL